MCESKKDDTDNRSFFVQKYCTSSTTITTLQKTNFSQNIKFISTAANDVYKVIAPKIPSTKLDTIKD